MPGLMRGVGRALTPSSVALTLALTPAAPAAQAQPAARAQPTAPRPTTEAPARPRAGVPASRPGGKTSEPRRRSTRPVERRAEPPAPTRRRTLRERAADGAAPKDDPGQEDAVPPLDTDPFRPPKGSDRAPVKAQKHRPWFVRPSVVFVARLSKNRDFMPQEGFGFGVQVGATLGRSTLRLSLAAGYHFYRLARTLDIVVNDPQLTSCTAIRTLGYHLVTGSAQALASFSKVALWAGLRGGFAHAQLKTPTPTCGTDDGSLSTGALGPEIGVGYTLRPDLHIGVTLAYLHFFSDKVYTSVEGTSHRYFYDMITAGAALTLRF